MFSAQSSSFDTRNQFPLFKSKYILIQILISNRINFQFEYSQFSSSSECFDANRICLVWMLRNPELDLDLAQIYWCQNLIIPFLRTKPQQISRERKVFWTSSIFTNLIGFFYVGNVGNVGNWYFCYPSIRLCSLFKVRHVIGCIYHDI